MLQYLSVVHMHKIGKRSLEGVFYKYIWQKLWFSAESTTYWNKHGHTGLNIFLGDLLYTGQ